MEHQSGGRRKEFYYLEFFFNGLRDLNIASNRMAPSIFNPKIKSLKKSSPTRFYYIGIL